jgi:hypothetical protein
LIVHISFAQSFLLPFFDCSAPSIFCLSSHSIELL